MNRLRGTTISVSSVVTDRFDVALLPAVSEQLDRATVIVVDFLRATTAIISGRHIAQEVFLLPSIKVARVADKVIGACSVVARESQRKNVARRHL